MTCENCLMFTHCRYDLSGNGKPCENFIDKQIINTQKGVGTASAVSSHTPNTHYHSSVADSGKEITEDNK